jgi:hypothetical protein
MKSRRATGERDQGEIEAFAIGYWGFERQCIPDYKTNRECTLVSKRFDMGAILDKAGGVLANDVRRAWLQAVFLTWSDRC